MNFMTEEELDGYLVLIFFMLKKKKSMPSKKPYKILVKGNIQKESSRRTLQRTLSYFNVLLFILIWPKIYSFFITHICRAGEIHFTLGEGMEFLKSIIGHNTFVSILRFNDLFFRFSCYFQLFS